MTITTLDDLARVLRDAPEMTNDGAQAAYATAHGLPQAHGGIDMSNLPTFGGDGPANTVGVWSWDATRMIVGICRDDFRIALRSDV